MIIKLTDGSMNCGEFTATEIPHLPNGTFRVLHTTKGTTRVIERTGTLSVKYDQKVIVAVKKFTKEETHA